MSERASDISAETAMLKRLAEAHKVWRGQRPQPAPRKDSHAEMTARAMNRIRNPEPQDVELIREAVLDPLGTAITSQLSVVGWRLYAKGGVNILTSVYQTIEREHHPGFAWALHRAWRGLGFPEDPRGIWDSKNLL